MADVRRLIDIVEANWIVATSAFPKLRQMHHVRCLRHARLKIWVELENRQTPRAIFDSVPAHVDISILFVSGERERASILVTLHQIEPHLVVGTVVAHNLQLVMLNSIRVGSADREQDSSIGLEHQGGAVWIKHNLVRHG